LLADNLVETRSARCDCVIKVAQRKIQSGMGPDRDAEDGEIDDPGHNTAGLSGGVQSFGSVMPESCKRRMIIRARAVVTMDGREVTIEIRSGFPSSPGAVLEISLDGEATFAVLVRAPRWAQPLSVRGVPEAALDDRGFLVVPARAWRSGDRLEIDFALASRLVQGDFGNSGLAARRWGPIVLAYDEAGAAFVPFADAGASGGKFRVWAGPVTAGEFRKIYDPSAGEEVPWYINDHGFLLWV